MRIQYFSDTDTLHSEFRPADPAENTLLYLDRNGPICAIMVEHVRERAGLPKFSYEQAT